MLFTPKSSGILLLLTIKTLIKEANLKTPNDSSFFWGWETRKQPVSLSEDKKEIVRKDVTVIAYFEESHLSLTNKSGLIIAKGTIRVLFLDIPENNEKGQLKDSLVDCDVLGAYANSFDWVSEKENDEGDLSFKGPLELDWVKTFAIWTNDVSGVFNNKESELKDIFFEATSTMLHFKKETPKSQNLNRHITLSFNLDHGRFNGDSENITLRLKNENDKETLKRLTKIFLDAHNSLPKNNNFDFSSKNNQAGTSETDFSDDSTEPDENEVNPKPSDRLTPFRRKVIIVSIVIIVILTLCGVVYAYFNTSFNRNRFVEGGKNEYLVN